MTVRELIVLLLQRAPLGATVVSSDYGTASGGVDTLYVSVDPTGSIVNIGPFGGLKDDITLVREGQVVKP
jgi:hypothetical protein